MALPKTELPIPGYFAQAIEDRAEEIYVPDYQARAAEAVEWAYRHKIKPAGAQAFDFALLIVDFQIAFCMLIGSLFVGGRSGRGAIDDVKRLCYFILKYGHLIKRIITTLDTHRAMAVFHGMFWVDKNGKHPNPGTQITTSDVRRGVWSINPRIIPEMFNGNVQYAQRFALHYVMGLEAGGKQLLIVWPYHVLLGGIDHALVPILHEVIFFWEVMRSTMRESEVKGGDPFREMYSAVNAEVRTMPDPDPEKPDVIVTSRNTRFVKNLVKVDAAAVATEAKSHCGSATIEDFGSDFIDQDPELVRKVYLGEDVTSSVYIPGAGPNGTDLDFTDVGDAAYQKFGGWGMNLVLFEEAPWTWPGVIQEGFR